MKKKDVKKIALITASGIGSRMGQDIPKQFLSVFDKPVVVYTMECFEKHPEIDAIVVVCLKGWENVLEAYAKQFNITKLVSIINGGETGFESIVKGTKEIKRLFDDEDIIIVHDGIRPNVSSDIISNNIAVCEKYGNGIVAIPCREAMIYTENHTSGDKEINRDNLVRTQTPHSFHVGELYKMQQEGIKRGLVNPVAMVSLLTFLGGTAYFSPGSEKNIKLTTPDDIEIFKALLKEKKADWIK